MTNQAGSASVTAPVGQAIEHVKRFLFRPFDIDRWVIVGFCAWLAYLGETGFSFRYHGKAQQHQVTSGNFHEQLEHARAYVMANLAWIVPLAVGIVLFLLATGVLVTWLKSRGEFMFLYCVALDRAEVSTPWRRYKTEGNSLFLFRLVLALMALAPVWPLLLIGIPPAFRMYHMGRVDAPDVLVLVAVFFVFFLTGMVFLVIRKLTLDFVVPIMFLRSKRCWEAWQEFLPVLARNLGNFVIYLLFQIVLTMGIFMMVAAAVLATCCIAGCLMMIPYLGAVLLLPVLMFKRSYSLHYLAQYGPEYNVFPPVPSAPLPPPPPPPPPANPTAAVW